MAREPALAATPETVASSTGRETVGAVALGSSLGDRLATLRLALAALEVTPGIEVLRVSRAWRNAPAGGVARGEFLNAVALVCTTLPARALLARCKAIEARLGRRPTPRWGDRVIDLDILFLGQEILDTADLRLPHPEIRRRPFVLIPLAEVAPDARDPRDGELWCKTPQPSRQGLIGAGRIASITPRTPQASRGGPGYSPSQPPLSTRRSP